MKKSFFNDETIIAFHISRGGVYNNPNFLTCLGEHKIGEFIDNLFPPTDEDGNEIEGEYTDDCGNLVDLTTSDVKSGIGRINIDEEYDTIYTEKLVDIHPYSREAYAMVNESDSFTKEQSILYFLQSAYTIEEKKQLLLDLDVDVDEIKNYIK